MTAYVWKYPSRWDDGIDYYLYAGHTSSLKGVESRISGVAFNGNKHFPKIKGRDVEVIYEEHIP